mgnify:CR=1 FL=1|jgi:hypothetical protein
MRVTSPNRIYSAGVTLVELLAALTIAAIATIGLGSGITTIVGAYQDDWVTKEVRFWGYEAVELIVNYVETADKITIRPPWNGYYGLLIDQAPGQPNINIEGSKKRGLTKNGQALLEHVEWPRDGTYRSDGQRVIELERFEIKLLKNDPDSREAYDLNNHVLERLNNSLYLLDLVIAVTTKYQGEEMVEYVTFNRILWARDKYFGGNRRGRNP